VQVEYVTRISLTAWRATEQQGYLAVSHGLLGKIIIYYERRTTGIAEESPIAAPANGAKN
jgi:hypothetical protein